MCSETRRRVYGQDLDFCGWMRKQGGCLTNDRFVATDVDLIVHSYKTPDRSFDFLSECTQKVQILEVKTRNGEPTWSQWQTYWRIHVTSKRIVRLPNSTEEVHNYGVSFVSLSGTTPDNSETIRWGRFASGPRDVVWNEVSEELLTRLISAEVDPDCFVAQSDLHDMGSIE